MVFCGLFPVDANDFEDLRAAMGKLRLNDASFSFEMETFGRARISASVVASLGFCIWKSFRSVSSREFDLDLIATAPSVVYEMEMTNDEMITPA